MTDSTPSSKPTTTTHGASRQGDAGRAAHGPRGLGVVDVQARRAGAAVVQPIEQPRQPGRVAAHRHERLRLGDRPHLERDLDDRAERAESADVQLAQVVAGHVLDDPAAGLDLLPLVVDGGNAEDVVAQRAEAVAARAADVGGEGAAQRGPVGVRHVHGKALVLGGQHAAQLGDGNAGLHGDGHVAGGVIDDAVEGPDVHDPTGPGGRQAEAEHRAAADGVDGLPFGGRSAHYVAHLRDGLGTNDGEGAEVVDAADGVVHDGCLGLREGADRRAPLGTG